MKKRTQGKLIKNYTLSVVACKMLPKIASARGMSMSGVIETAIRREYAEFLAAESAGKGGA